MMRKNKKTKRFVANDKHYRLGMRDGYRAGVKEGYRISRCESAWNCAQRDRGTREKRSLTVLYVSSGLWSYTPMDQGIVRAFSEQVQQLVVTSPHEDVVAKAAEIRPDFVLSLNSVECLARSQVQKLRELGIKTAVWFTDDPYYIDDTVEIALCYDYVFTLEETCVSFYKERGCHHVFHLPFAVNDMIYHPMRRDPAYESDICFIGSGFWNRISFIDEIASYLSHRRVVIAGYWWDRLQHYSKLKDQIHNGIWISPEETAKYYNAAKLTVNLHRGVHDESNRNRYISSAESVNPRTFEISACATVQFTDERSSLKRLYIPNVHVVTFHGAQDFIEKAEDWLKREEDRLEVSTHAIYHTMKNHSYARRIEQLLDIMIS